MKPSEVLPIHLRKVRWRHLRGIPLTVGLRETQYNLATWPHGSTAAVIVPLFSISEYVRPDN